MITIMKRLMKQSRRLLPDFIPVIEGAYSLFLFEKVIKIGEVGVSFLWIRLSSRFHRTHL